MNIKQKKLFIAGACTALIIIVAGVVAIILISHHKTHKVLSTTNSIQNTNSSTGSSLSVNNSSSSSQGQLGQQPSSSTSNSSSSTTVDPTTFSQYNKYSTSTQTLFGDIKAGTGATAAKGSAVEIVYKGWLTNGTEFDQSQSDSSGNIEPLSFTLGDAKVISGMEEGVDGMKVGGIRLIIIPPSLGYGATATGTIPANSVLVFEVQLVSVK
jgi:FKBP-type peptidyl-prolyl cis-trans isomerase FkpA